MTPPPAKKETRHEAQVRIDDLRMKGKITESEWSVLFDDLSNLKKWGPEGLLEETQPTAVTKS